MRGRVVAVFINPEPGVVRSADLLVAHAGKGFEGDCHFGKRSRQALLIAEDEIAQFGYEAGQLCEQVTVAFPGLQSLATGTRLRAGTVELQIEGDCAPCTSMAKRLDEDPEEFKAKTAGHRGMLARVESDGEIRPGDEVILVQA